MALNQEKPFVGAKVVYLICAHQVEDSVGFGWNFRSEIISDKERAEKRHGHLRDKNPPHSGMFFSLEPVEIDTENEDY